MLYLQKAARQSKSVSKNNVTLFQLGSPIYIRGPLESCVATPAATSHLLLLHSPPHLPRQKPSSTTNFPCLLFTSKPPRRPLTCAPPPPLCYPFKGPNRLGRNCIHPPPTLAPNPPDCPTNHPGNHYQTPRRSYKFFSLQLTGARSHTAASKKFLLFNCASRRLPASPGPRPPRITHKILLRSQFQPPISPT